MSAPTLLSPRPLVTQREVFERSQAMQRELKSRQSAEDLAQQIAEREPIADPIFKRQDFPGHRHYATCDDGATCLTVHTYAANGGDVVAMTVASAAGEHYSAQRFTVAKARALAAELIAAADSLDVAGGRA